MDFHTLSLASLHRYAALYHLSYSRSINQSQLADLVSCHFHTPSLIPEVQEDWSLHLFCTKLHVKTIRPSVAPKLRPLYPIKKAKPSKKKLLKASKKKTSTTAHVYCICHGASQGNMIACDNEACKDSSNWYHMDCIGLGGIPIPSIWYCPLCVNLVHNDAPTCRVPTYTEMIQDCLLNCTGNSARIENLLNAIEKKFSTQLNWKKTDKSKSPVWHASVKKILNANQQFRQDDLDNQVFYLAR